MSSVLNLCSELKTDEDVTTLKSWLSDVYTNLAMVDYPYPANFLAPLPANPINVSVPPTTTPHRMNAIA